MTPQLAFSSGPLADEAEFDTIEPILSQSLHFPPGRMRAWLELIGREHMRVTRLNGAPIAGLSSIPMAQWFGGRSVPTAGITAVGVAPEQRGRGAATHLFRALFEELRAGGTPLSALYPATIQFYRSLGYERAGARTIYALPMDAVSVRERSLDIVPAAQPDADLLQQIYSRHARRQAGTIDRTPVFWQRLLAPADLTVYTYLVLRGAEPEGYIIFAQGGPREDIKVRDICALSRQAALRLLTFLADHRSMAGNVLLPGAPVDPFLHLLSEQRATIHQTMDWMLRIIDVAGALAARGYPAGLRAELELAISDPLLPWNQGHFSVAIADGRASVRPGGAGRLRLHIRDLACLYSGYATAAELQLAGGIEGDEADLATAGLVFSGPRPWMADMF